MNPEQAVPEMLAATLNDSNGRDFLHDLYNGYLLNVVVGVTNQTFSLSGTSPAP